MSQNPTTPDPVGAQGAGYGQPVDAGYGQPVGQPPAYGGQQQAYNYNYSQAGYGAPYGQAGYVEPKSKVAAALLAFFLGTIGAHNFYRGQTRNGVIHLCLVGAAIVLIFVGAISVAGSIDTTTGEISSAGAAGLGLFMLLGWLAAVGNAIWAFVEFIMILVSNDGSLR